MADTPTVLLPTGDTVPALGIGTWNMGDRRQTRASEIAAYPWFADNKDWQKEIAQMLKNGFKMEVESLITKDISYVTEEYVPERLKKKDWLD